MVRYTLTVDEAFLVETLERNREYSAMRFGRYGVKVICLAGMTLIVALLIWVRAYWLAALMSAFVVLLLLGPRIDYWLAKRRLRKSPFYHQRVTVSLDQSGFQESTELSLGKMDWRAFTRAIRLRDGFLLFSGPKPSHWLPDSALSEGNVAEAQQLIQQKVASYAG